jgi:hypothetical protein
VKKIKGWWHSTGFFSPPWLVTVAGVIGAVVFAIVLNRDTNQHNCEQRAGSIIAARADYAEQLRRIDEPLNVTFDPIPGDLEPGDLETLAYIGAQLRKVDQAQDEIARDYFTSRLASIHPIACESGEARELPIPDG